MCQLRITITETSPVKSIICCATGITEDIASELHYSYADQKTAVAAALMLKMFWDRSLSTSMRAACNMFSGEFWKDRNNHCFNYAQCMTALNILIANSLLSEDMGQICLSHLGLEDARIHESELNDFFDELAGSNEQAA